MRRILAKAVIVLTTVALMSVPMVVSAQEGEAVSPPSPVYSIDGLYDRPSSEKHPFLRDFRAYVDAADEAGRNALLDRVFGADNWVLQVRISGNVFQKDGQSGFYKWGDFVCEFDPVEDEDVCYNVAEKVDIASDLPTNRTWLTLGAEFRERDFTETRRYCQASAARVLGYLNEDCVWM